MLNKRQKDQFLEAGYVVVEDLISTAAFGPLIGEFEEEIETKAQEQYAAGKLRALYPDAPFDRRLALLCAASDDYEELWQLGMGKDHKTAGMFAVWRYPSLVDIVEQFVGPEILAHPQFNSRAKLPQQERTVVPWHQDGGLLDREVDDTMMVNFWIPLMDATMETGALQVMPGSHKWDVLPHQRMGFYNGVREEHLPPHEVVDCPVPFGGGLLLQQRTMHRSVANGSDRVRWSLDLRYCHADAPTGRAQVPGFVVRSEREPGRVARSYRDWVVLFE